MVVVCRHFMSTGCVVLVGTGPIADLLMQQASDALARETGRQLVSHSVGESPDAVLSSGAECTGLLRLNGDAARLHPNGGSWLSALADWRLPVLLLTPGDSDGGVSGAAAAWVALCRELGVPLLGVVQLRGPWLSQARRRDGLPWCGWIPEHNHPQHQDGVTALAGLIRRGQLTASPKAAASSRV